MNYHRHQVPFNSKKYFVVLLIKLIIHDICKLLTKLVIFSVTSPSLSVALRHIKPPYTAGPTAVPASHGRHRFRSPCRPGIPLTLPPSLASATLRAAQNPHCQLSALPPLVMPGSVPSPSSSAWFWLDLTRDTVSPPSLSQCLTFFFPGTD